MVANVAAISWREQITFRWNKTHGIFVITQSMYFMGLNYTNTLTVRKTYQSGNQKPKKEEVQIIQWPTEKRQKSKKISTKHKTLHRKIKIEQHELY